MHGAMDHLLNANIDEVEKAVFFQHRRSVQSGSRSLLENELG
jgi:hypothetical protein